MERAQVRPKGRSESGYAILIEAGIIKRIASNFDAILPEEKEPSSIVVLTDSNLTRLGLKLQKQLKEYVAKSALVTFPAGEKSKTAKNALELLSKFASLEIDRKGLVICLGGGVVGDLGGFVASVYKRGIAYMQLPTTLLAQVDSSIGGKTGVDTSSGKNQIGTFYQPKVVIIDPEVLDTLPRSELINGLGEIVKYSVISSAKMFGRLEESDLNSLAELKKFIPACARIKARIVSQDEMEVNLRAILNYGHTVGHALEAGSLYHISHGKAVMLGMMAEGWIARELGLFRKDDFERQLSFLSRICSRDFRKVNLDLGRDRLLQYALADKKNSSGKIRMCLPEKIGKMHQVNEHYLTEIPKKMFGRSIDYLCKAGFLDTRL